MNPSNTAAPVVLQSTVQYKYEMCKNMTAEVPLCFNSTEYAGSNETDEEIRQVSITQLR